MLSTAGGAAPDAIEPMDIEMSADSVETASLTAGRDGSSSDGGRLAMASASTSEHGAGGGSNRRGSIDDQRVAITKYLTSPSRRARVIAAGLLVVAVVVGAIVAAVLLSSRANSGFAIPQTFQASFLVNHKAVSTELPYSGVVHKTVGPDGRWQVSATVTARTTLVTEYTVYTFLNDRAYYQVLDSSNAVQSAGCLTRMDVPLIGDFAGSLEAGTVVPTSQLSATAIAECGSVSEATVVNWNGQAYVFCHVQASQSYALVGEYFSASMFEVDTTAPAESPIKVPTDASGQDLSCPTLGVVLPSATAVARRLQSPADPWLWDDGRQLFHGGSHQCCNCRRLSPLRTAPTRVNAPTALPTPRPTTGGAVGQALRPTQVPFHNLFSKTNTVERPVCICCLLRGMEGAAAMEMYRRMCTDIIMPNIDASKPWDDPAEQTKICNALKDSNGNIREGMHVIGMSTGNLMLGGALYSGRCSVANAQDFSWTVVPGLLEDIDNPYQYCATFGGPTNAVSGSQTACVQSNGQWVPSPALLATITGYPHLADVRNVIDTTATIVLPKASLPGGTGSRSNVYTSQGDNTLTSTPAAGSGLLSSTTFLTTTAASPSSTTTSASVSSYVSFSDAGTKTTGPAAMYIGASSFDMTGANGGAYYSPSSYSVTRGGAGFMYGQRRLEDQDQSIDYQPLRNPAGVIETTMDYLISHDDE